MKYSLIKIIILFLGILIFSTNCKNDSSTSQGKTTGFTNATDQEYILLSQEFDQNNFKKVIEFINSYFKKNKLKNDNLKLLLLKSQAKEKLVKKFNKKLNKNIINEAKKYNFKIIKNKVTYQYEELKTIWEKFPKTTYGKDAFYQYIDKLTNPFKKIASYENFINKIKKDSLKNKLRYKLSELYLQNLINLQSKTSEKLSKLYKQLIKTQYKDKILFDAIILKYKLTGNRTEYKNKLKNYLKEKNSNAIIANYLLGEIEFIENHLKKAKDYFEQTQKMFKYIKNKEDMPLLIANLEQYPDLSITRLKISVRKKIKLIERLIKYTKSLINKKIGFIIGERVRVREKPVIYKKNIMTTLNYGDKVTIIKRSDKKIKIENDENYWYHIQLMDNTSGWIYGKYLLFFIY